jgi:hypothetical protein
MSVYRRELRSRIGASLNEYCNTLWWPSGLYTLRSSRRSSRLTWMVLADWWREDQEQALLIACLSLIAVAEDSDGYSRVAQFLHFSVKEFLTSSRFSTARGEVSAYRIDLEDAHTILAQACLGVLLQKHGRNASKVHPLAECAAEHWTTYAQFGDVSSRLQKGMESLDKPHLWSGKRRMI